MFFPCCTIFILHFFLLHVFMVCFFYNLLFFHIKLFPCRRFFKDELFSFLNLPLPVDLISCCTISIFHFLCCAIFMLLLYSWYCYFYTFLTFDLISCCTFFMWNFFHVVSVALFLCFHSLDVTFILVSAFSSFVVFILYCVMFLTVCIVSYTLFSCLHTK